MNEKPVKVFLFGIIFSLLYCFIELLSVPSLTYRQIRDSVIIDTLLLYCFDFFIPFVLSLGLVFITSRKSINEKLKMLFPFLLGFYSVYIIYSSTLRYEKISSFLMFCKPLLTFCLIFITSQLIIMFTESIQQNKNKLHAAGVFIVLFLATFIPSLIQVLSDLNLLKIVRVILVLLYEIGFFALFIYLLEIQLKKYSDRIESPDNKILLSEKINETN
ncbi:MAG: hypothetical protein K5839_07510 [Treponemataceae bacterium]|nr:hypothetical protein [Treponemataceae bacterium]